MPSWPCGALRILDECWSGAKGAPYRPRPRYGRTAKLLLGDLLQKDYADTVEKLERYRRKIDYLSYNRERSVHFNRQNVLDCLADMQACMLRCKGSSPRRRNCDEDQGIGPSPTPGVPSGVRPSRWYSRGCSFCARAWEARAFTARFPNSLLTTSPSRWAIAIVCRCDFSITIASNCGVMPISYGSVRPGFSPW